MAKGAKTKESQELANQILVWLSDELQIQLQALSEKIRLRVTEEDLYVTTPHTHNTHTYTQHTHAFF